MGRSGDNADGSERAKTPDLKPLRRTLMRHVSRPRTSDNARREVSSQEDRLLSQTGESGTVPKYTCYGGAQQVART